VKELTTNKVVTTCSLVGEARGMSDCMTTWLMLPASKSGVAPLLSTWGVAVVDMADLLDVVLREERARLAEERIDREEGIRLVDRMLLDRLYI
jgi:hypothetical protein